MTVTHRQAQGVHGVGSATFNADEYARVVAAFLAHTGPVTAAQLHLETGVSGVTLRQIMAAADGVEFLLGGSGAEGYCRAETFEDAARLTDRFVSQIGRMSERVQRRRARAATLAVAQPELFEVSP